MKCGIHGYEMVIKKRASVGNCQYSVVRNAKRKKRQGTKIAVAKKLFFQAATAGAGIKQN